MKNLLKENKYIIVIISVIFSYTIWCAYYFSQPSEIEMKAQAVTDLRTEWGKIQKDLVQCEKLNDYKVNDLEPRIRQAEKDLLGKK